MAAAEERRLARRAFAARGLMGAVASGGGAPSRLSTTAEDNARDVLAAGATRLPRELAARLAMRCDRIIVMGTSCCQGAARDSGMRSKMDG